MSEWMPLQLGAQLASFGHPINYAGYPIDDQGTLDVLLALTEVLEESGATDLQISTACTSFMRERARMRSIN